MFVGVFVLRLVLSRAGLYVSYVALFLLIGWWDVWCARVWVSCSCVTTLGERVSLVDACACVFACVLCLSVCLYARAVCV